MAVAARVSTEDTLPDLTVAQVIDFVFKFHQALTGHTFFGYQFVFCRRIVESVLLNDGATITGLWSRQSGKTTAVAELMITLAIILPVLAQAFPHIQFLHPFLEGILIGIFAPIEHQAGLSYRKMRKIIHGERAREILEDEEINVEIETSRGDTLSLSNGANIWARTASVNSKVEGETFHIILLDESQDLDRFKVEKEIEPMRAATRGTMVKIGTANFTKGGFKTDIEYNIEAHKLGKAPRNHFQFDYKQVIADRRAMAAKTGNTALLNYEKYVQDKRRKFGGEKSLSFRLNFLLEWQLSSQEAFSARTILSCEDFSRQLNQLPGTAERDVDRLRESNWIRVGGLDIAKINDSTVATVMEYDVNHPVSMRDKLTGEMIHYYPKRVAGLLELQGLFEDSSEGEGQYTSVVNFFRKWGVERVVMDSTGMGNPTYERLQVLAPEIEWVEFKFSAPSKTNLYKHYVDEFEAGRVKIAAGGPKNEQGQTVSQESHEFEAFIEQHKNLEREVRGQYVDYRAPKRDRNRPDQEEDEIHDDYPTSGALAAWGVKTHLLQEVRVDTPGQGSHTSRNVRVVSTSTGMPQDVVVDGRTVGNKHRYRRRW